MSAGYGINSGVVALSGTTAKTLAQVINASNGLVRITEATVSTDGVTASAVPALLEMVKSTQATAGTAGGSTITQIRGPTRTVQATAGYAYSAEPTVLTAVKSYYVPQYNGLLVLQFPLGREPEQVTSANAMGFKLTPTATVNVRCNLEFEEG